jgi:hypothetical protein
MVESGYDDSTTFRVFPMKHLVPILAASLLFAGPVNAAEQDLETGDRGVTAPGQPTYTLDSPPSINRLDFDFRIEETKTWLNKDGDFQVNGWVKHLGLLCATYRVGVRFGVGSPGCLNVNWVTEPYFVTSEYQCNSARVQHAGGDTYPELGEQLGKISCAERVINCTGSCK